MSWVDVLRKLGKKLQFGTPVGGNGTPVGVGVPLALLTLAIAKNTLIIIYIDISNYVGADNAEITITGSVSGGPAIIIGRIDVVAGSVTRVMGSPFYGDPAVAQNTTDVQAYQFEYYTDSVIDFYVTVNQSAGAVMKQVNYRYNTLTEL